MTKKTIAEVVGGAGHHERDVFVEISYDVIQLLSDHLYSSPLKAIEELMVNSWDADASECRIHVPTPEQLNNPDESTVICVWDDGRAMDADELESLWHVGTSEKRKSSHVAERKQIGKFGIGKLATYVIARRVTYVSKRDSTIRALTLDYERFSDATKSDGTTDSVKLDQRTLEPADLLTDKQFIAVCKLLGIESKRIVENAASWTLAVLEELKPKASEIRIGRLNWVLRTALPLTDEFRLFLNKEQIESAKETGDWLVDFDVSEIDGDRLKSLNQSTGENWKIKDGAVCSDSFPNGIIGRVRVSEKSLYKEQSKSEDLGRSHGFFIRVRGRLINQSDPLFGLKPLSFETFNRFNAKISVDDLDASLTAPRDDVQQSPAKSHFRDLLGELFNQARATAQQELNKRDQQERQKREGERSYVNTRLLERPLVDALVGHRGHSRPANEWLLVEADADEAAIDKLVQALHSEEPTRRRYTYRYANRTPADRLVEFDPENCEFTINLDHELVLEYGDESASRRLLELMVTAEAMLEVYLREFEIEDAVIAQVIERRDSLLRSLATDEQYSLKAISRALRNAADDDKDLEIAVVAAARALGFVARHISFAGEPDGTAGYAANGREDKSFTLEAKSSSAIPSLGAIDFAGLRSHYEQHNADGCMLVAPSYPGTTKKQDAEAAKRAIQQRVSCWTIELLAKVVEQAEKRHITAQQVQEIVLGTFSPDDVSARVGELLAEPEWVPEDLRLKVLDALDQLETALPNSTRSTDTIAGILVGASSGFRGAEKKHIEEALVELAKASKGLLHVSENEEIFVRGSVDELRRRVAGSISTQVKPRRLGTFRKSSDSDDEKNE